MERVRDFQIVSRWCEDGNGWKSSSLPFTGTYEDAARRASRAAVELDAAYGDSHFWTVDLYSGNENGGSYFQLFHGRLS